MYTLAPFERRYVRRLSRASQVAAAYAVVYILNGSAERPHALSPDHAARIIARIARHEAPR